MTSPSIAYLMKTTALDTVLKHLLPVPNRAPVPVGLNIEIEEVARG